MPIVVDASVAFKWFVPESGGDAALALLDEDEPLWAPDLVLVELGNALFTRLRSVSGGRDAAIAAIARTSQIYSFLAPTSEFVRRAVELSFELMHPAYDCIYLALCEAHDLRLLTADQRFRGKVIGTAHQDRVVML